MLIIHNVQHTSNFGKKEKCPYVHHTSAPLNLPRGQGSPSNDVMEMSQNTRENKTMSRSE